MCGIFGISVKDKSHNLKADLARMGALLKHRGPDDEGFLIDPLNGVFLGHKRLSIIDLSDKARQPMFNEDKTIALLFNGEIYNYKDLKEQLIGKGHRFYSHTDSETIVHAYEQWGEDCVTQLRGMFAFCIWDSRENKIILARDHVGIKPLYYINNAEIFAFASEVKAFLGLNKNIWQPRINNDALEFLLIFPFIPDNQMTMLGGVNKLPAGHILIYKNKNVIIKKYWELDSPEENIDLEKACLSLEHKLLEAVKLHLQADVPVGILLSGGIDSSLISALASKVKPGDVHTFTVGYDHPWDERPFAKQVARHINSSHTDININPAEINEKIEEVIWYFDDLTTLDGGIFSNYLISEKVKSYGVKVVLVGEGADEVFGGYSWFGLSLLPFKVCPDFFRSALYHYAFTRVIFNKNIFKSISFLNGAINKFNEKDIFRKISRFEIEYQLPNNYLMKMDKATMAHSLEARVPYLDREIVEFAYGLPREYKITGSWFNMKQAREKFILRQIARKYLPPDIVTRKKRGFSVPVPEVLRSNMDKVRSYVLDRNGVARQFLQQKKLEKLFDFRDVKYSPLEKEKETLLWKFFIIEAWKRQYLKFNN